MDKIVGFGESPSD